MDLIIRRAKNEDVDILNNLFQKLLEFEKEKYDKNIKDNLSITSYFNKRVSLPTNIILIAQLENKIVGYIYSTIDSDNKIKKDLEAKIDSIYIMPKYRNKSIGTKLIDEILNILKLENVKYVFIENLVNNYSSKYLYEKLGFEVFRETRRKEI